MLTLGLLVQLALIAPTLGCYYLDFVSRTEWGAIRGKKLDRMNTPVNKVFIHHTSGPGCSNKFWCILVVETIQLNHIYRNGWDDIGYNFLIGGDGRVYVGRGWNNEGAHTYGYNDKAIAIAFIGNYESKSPSSKMLSAARNLIFCGIGKRKIARNYGLYGHRDVNDTECPGDSLYNIIKRWSRWHARGQLQFYYEK